MQRVKAMIIILFRVLKSCAVTVMTGLSLHRRTLSSARDCCAARWAASAAITLSTAAIATDAAAAIAAASDIAASAIAASAAAASSSRSAAPSSSAESAADCSASRSLVNVSRSCA